MKSLEEIAEARSRCPRSAWRKSKSPVFVVLALVSLWGAPFGASSSRGEPATPPKSAWKSVFIRSVDLKAQTITVDSMLFLTGPDAVRAYRRDTFGYYNRPLPGDYYIAHSGNPWVVLRLARGAIVKLAKLGGAAHLRPVPVPQTKLVGYPGITSDRKQTAAPFWIAVQDGKVTEIYEQFVP